MRGSFGFWGRGESTGNCRSKDVEDQAEPELGVRGEPLGSQSWNRGGKLWCQGLVVMRFISTLGLDGMSLFRQRPTIRDRCGGIGRRQ